MMIITIDGPSGAGKGTIASYLAQCFALRHLDTGLLYRAVAYQALIQNVDLENEEGLGKIAQQLDLDALVHVNLRAEELAGVASQIARFPGIRSILTLFQRNFVSMTHLDFNGVVLDGRDIGTVVLPNAPCKLFVTADLDVRMMRRLIENDDGQVTKEMLAAQMQQRDNRDQNRSVDPLKSAEDALIIDTTNLSILEACEQAAEYVRHIYGAV